MTFEKILEDLSTKRISAQDAKDQITQKDKMRTIHYYSHFDTIATEAMKPAQLQELHAIVGILQVLYDSNEGSPISDTEYDSMEEILVNLGIPRMASSVELNDQKKISHTHTRLRGTLSKIYYLEDEPRTNKSRKRLDEWLASASARYEKATGKQIDFNQVKILVQPKFDGCAVNEERSGNVVWITRGDTTKNQASDVTRIMRQFNDVFPIEDGGAIKFECMMPEDNRDKINEFYKQHPYSDSRQIVISIFNTVEPDFKVDYLYPVPLRIIHPSDEIESIHPTLLEKFPTMICTFGDRDLIRNFANEHRYVIVNGVRLRTDGAVMTIMDPNICKALGRENNINYYEVAYKFTEETAIARVKDIEFYVSEFGHITPVLVVNDVHLKGKTVNHISMANKERFDELQLHYGDEVRIHYDIIPYVTVDDRCRRARNGRIIPFVKRCPACHKELDLDVVEVQCHNPDCPSRRIGRILNYCKVLRIKNIGYSTIEALYNMELLEHGIRDLYRLKKCTANIQDLDGFGKLKTKKMIREIESKRRLVDYEFFGALGIEDLGTKTFQQIFQRLPMQKFLDMIRLKNFDLLRASLVVIPGIGDKKADWLIRYYQMPEHQKELQKLLKEVTLFPSYGEQSLKRVVFTGCRPDESLKQYLKEHQYQASDSWSKDAAFLIVPHEGYPSSKVEKARSANIPILQISEIRTKIQ